MAMDKLMAEVKECIEREYGRVGAHTGFTYHSDHEAHSIILEEMDEAVVEFTSAHQALNALWESVKHDDSDDNKYKQCKAIETRAMLAACEFIQVAVTAKKAAGTICDRGALKEFRESVVKMNEDLHRNRPR